MIQPLCPCSPTEENQSEASALALAVQLFLASPPPGDQVFNIPIVFNCCGNASQASDPNITDAQLEEQVYQLNLDFRAQNPDYTTDCPSNMLNVRSGDCRINFYIQDIRRRFTSALGSYWHNSYYAKHRSLAGTVYESMKTAQYGLTALQPETALNIWVAWHSDDGTASISAASTAGYAGLPNASAPKYHPHVVVQAGSIGSIRSPAPESYTLGDQRNGRVLVHEVGHFLGLWHSWGSGAWDGTQCTRDTNCPDLPLAKGACLWGNFNPPAILTKGCPGTGEPYNNHMNYGEYGSSFTPDQKNWMRTFNLYNSHAQIGSALRPFKTSETTAVSVGSSSAARAFFGSTKVWEKGAPPGAPTLTVQSGFASAALSWTVASPPADGSSVTEYIIEYKQASESTWISIATPSSVRTFTINNLAGGVLHNFRVAAKTSLNVRGPWSSTVSATPTAPPNLHPVSADLAGSGTVEDPMRTTVDAGWYGRDYWFDCFSSGTYSFTVWPTGAATVLGLAANGTYNRVVSACVSYTGSVFGCSDNYTANLVAGERYRLRVSAGASWATCKIRSFLKY